MSICNNVVTDEQHIRTVFYKWKVFMLPVFFATVIAIVIVHVEVSGEWLTSQPRLPLKV